MQLTLSKPHLTEKSLRDASSSVFTFVVARGASKHAVKTAVETAFKVHVLSVRTATTKGGSRRTGKQRRPVALTPKKFARVQLKKGEKIPLFESREK